MCYKQIVYPEHVIRSSASSDEYESGSVSTRTHGNSVSSAIIDQDIETGVSPESTEGSPVDRLNSSPDQEDQLIESLLKEVGLGFLISRCGGLDNDPGWVW